MLKQMLRTTVIFRPKEGPILVGGRATHVLFGALVAGWGYGVGGYLGLWIGAAIAIACGIIWEVATPWLAPAYHWGHPFGDWVDLGAFVVGALLAMIPILLF